MNTETANRLFEYRKKNHLSQEEVAEKIGVSRQAVSKWERGEASPDTDNLIMLAKLYGVSLDELILGEEKVQSSNADEPEQENNEAEHQEAYHYKNGTHTEENHGDKVHIGAGGIHVESRNGEKVHIGWNGVHVDSEKDNAHVHIGSDDHMHFNFEKCYTSQLHRFFIKFPYPLLAAMAYLIFGFFSICGGWAFGWLIFLTIPLYYTAVNAVFKRNASHFAYPVLVALVYLWLGFEYSLWHPMWIIFLTIPLYYFLCELIKGMLGKLKEQ